MSHDHAGFAALDSQLHTWVASGLLPGVAVGVLRDGELVHQACVGFADIARAEPLRPDHLHRAFSSTKLITACAVLLLWEQGKFGLDDPVQDHIPAFANAQVLRPNAAHIDDTEPARSPITIRQLFTHSSGLALGLLDPDSLLFQAYASSGVRDANLDLAQMMAALGPLPLAFHPGQRWGYSVATDVLARLVEIHSGQRFGDYLAQHIFGPLGMVDTAHHTPANKQYRLATLYGPDKHAANLATAPGCSARSSASESGSVVTRPPLPPWRATGSASAPG